MTGPEQFRDALERGDLKELRKIWRHVAPHLPQDMTDEQAEIVMHRARTEAETITLKARAYSHRYLTERGLPSGLPDSLKPSAERLYPRIATSVGISCTTSKDWLKPALIEVRTDMEHAVLEAYADGRQEPGFVRARMFEARDRARKRLFG